MFSNNTIIKKFISNCPNLTYRTSDRKPCMASLTSPRESPRHSLRIHRKFKWPHLSQLASQLHTCHPKEIWLTLPAIVSLSDTYLASIEDMDDPTINDLSLRHLLVLHKRFGRPQQPGQSLRFFLSIHRRYGCANQPCHVLKVLTCYPEEISLATSALASPQVYF